VESVVLRAARLSSRAALSFRVLQSLGLRHSELHRSSWLEVSAGVFCLFAKKGSEVRYFNESELLPAYVAYLRGAPGSEFMFSYSGLYRVFVHSSGGLGLSLATKSAGLHYFRYLYISELVIRGFSVSQIQVLLGHKDQKNTQRYIANCQTLNLL